MYIQNLELTSYRNYERAELQFENKVNVIIGENAQGKTNLMEAIYVLSMAKSHRTSNDKELIRWDEDYAKIEGRVMKRNGDIPMRLVISKKVKGQGQSYRATKTQSVCRSAEHHYVCP